MQNSIFVIIYKKLSKDNEQLCEKKRNKEKRAQPSILV